MTLENENKLEQTTNEEFEKIAKLFKDKNISFEEAKMLVKGSEKYEAQTHNSHNHFYGSRHSKILITSDWHYGHKNFRYDIFEDTVKVANKEKVDAIYHPGDVTEGMSNRDGHFFELAVPGVTNQVHGVAELINQYKQPFYFILGNHDLWGMKKGNQGVNIGRELEGLCPNATWLGDMKADVYLSPSCKMELSHEGSSAYALCFDDETEILTDDGWKLFSELDRTEKVATLNLKEDKFEWQKPTDYTDEEYNGEMLHFKARTFDLMVTPNHRMLVRRYNTAIEQSRLKNLIMPQKSHQRISKNWTIKLANELRNATRQQWQMKRGGQKWDGELIEKIKIPFRKPKKFASHPIKHVGELCIEDVAELIAWYVTEGYIRGGSMNICQSSVVNPDNHSQILDLLTRIGFEPKAMGRERKDIIINSVEFCEWLVKECGSGSRNKFLPKWLKEQPSEILEIVLETMIKGDGWVNGKAYGYKSISKKLREDFGEIALKLGYAVTEWKDSINISKIQTHPTINNKPDSINYSGRIYCVSVPNTYILVRRNGRAIWSGNSYSMQKRINAISGGDKPHIKVNGHIHKMLYMFYRNIHSIEAGTLEDQTEFMAMKGTPAHTGFWLLDIYYNKKGINRFTTTAYPYY